MGFVPRTGSILEVRANAFNLLLDACYDQLYRLASSGVCQRDDGVSECDCLQLGSLIPEIHSLGSWPTRPQPSNQSTSIRKLADKLAKVESCIYQIFLYDDWSNDLMEIVHTNCRVSTQMCRGIEEIMKTVASPLRDSHRSHLAAQAEK